MADKKTYKNTYITMEDGILIIKCPGDVVIQPDAYEAINTLIDKLDGKFNIIAFGSNDLEESEKNNDLDEGDPTIYNG